MALNAARIQDGLRSGAGDQTFKADLGQAQRTAFEAGLNRVQALTSKAIDTFEDLLDKGEQPSIRLGAARAVVDLAASRHDAQTLVGRLEELEQLDPIATGGLTGAQSRGAH